MARGKSKLLVERIDFGPELKTLESEWDQLLENSSHPSIFSSFDFIYTSCVHCQEDEEIFFLLFREEGSKKLVAIFPMSLDRSKFYGINLRMLYHGITPMGSDVDKPYPIIRKDAEDICWSRFRDYFRREFTQWDIIDYDEFKNDSFMVKHLRMLFPRPFYWTKIAAGPESPIVKLDGDWDEFWMGHRKLRKKSRKLEKKMGDRLVYKITSDPADAEQCLNDYIATELISWKAGEFVSEPDSQKFYRELFAKLAAKGRLYFGMMYDQEKVMSVEIAYIFKDRVFFAHGTYDPAYAELSPGTVNSSRLIQFFHGKGYVEGDFLAGYSSYNNPWASRIEKTSNVLIRRMGWRNFFLAFRHIEHKVTRLVKRLFGIKPKQGTGEAEVLSGETNGKEVEPC